MVLHLVRFWPGGIAAHDAAGTCFGNPNLRYRSQTVLQMDHSYSSREPIVGARGPIHRSRRRRHGWVPPCHETIRRFVPSPLRQSQKDSFPPCRKSVAEPQKSAQSPGCQAQVPGREIILDWACPQRRSVLAPRWQRSSSRRDASVHSKYGIAKRPKSKLRASPSPPHRVRVFLQQAQHRLHIASVRQGLPAPSRPHRVRPALKPNRQQTGRHKNA